MTGTDSREWERMGSALREALHDEARISTAVLQARQRLLGAAVRSSRTPVLARWLAVGAGAGVALVVADRMWRTEPSALAFVVGEPGRPGHVGEWIAPATADLPLAFSDGSQVALQPGSGARVVALRARGAEIVLEHGVAHVQVRHELGASWSLRAGAVLVEVTGTSFQVGWNPSTEIFSLALQEGSVWLSGGCGLESGRRLDAGQSIRVQCSEHSAAHADAADAVEPSDPVDSGSRPPSSESAARAPVDSTEKELLAGGEPKLAETPTWQEFARRRDFRGASAAVQSVGWDAACAAADAAELALLVETARVTRQPQRAMQALMALRTRFPADPRSRSAAFDLGVLYLDSVGDRAHGAQWFERYLQEQPTGPLAREAWGRLLEALVGLGDAARARQVASQYLDRYPAGPHAPIARRALETP